VELEARQGPWDIGPHYAPLDGWLYNGAAPGPLVEARLDETLIVRLTNALPEPTSLALSGPPPGPFASRLDTGVRTQGMMQSSPMVQPTETLEYRFPLTHIGTFWYHAGGDVMQIERGLHGVLIVREAAATPAMAERIIVLDDVCLGHRAPPRRARAGCVGNVLLMNGRVQPQLMMPAATVEQWRVVNVAHARPVRFSLGGAPFRRTAEWSPPSEQLRPLREATEATLDPGETVDLIVGPFEAGTLVHVQSVSHGTGANSGPLAPVFGTVLIGA
jgi:FtsP/CotA-like multicopper oxidase with cupredoxin domain